MKNNPESLEKRIYDKLLAVRRTVTGKSNWWKGYSAPELASDLILNLAFAAEKGKLIPEQYDSFRLKPRAELTCEFLREARDALTQNRQKYRTKQRGYFQTHEEIKREEHIYRLTRAQLIGRYHVKNWKDDRGDNGGKPSVHDFLYAEFLREKGLSDKNWANLYLTNIHLDAACSVNLTYYFLLH